MSEPHTVAASRSITVEGRVRETSRALTAAVSGREAAAVRYSVGFDETYTDPAGRMGTRRVRLGSVEASGDLIVETEAGVVWVPEGSFIFDVASEHLEPLLGSSGFPDELEPLTRGRSEAWLVSESVLAVGDPVELDATVRPSSRPGVDYEVVPQTGSKLRDRTLDDMADELALLREGGGAGRLRVTLAVVLAVLLVSLVAAWLALS